MDPQQNSDQESDALTVTKTSPMIIRLCTRPTDINKDLLSSENYQITESSPSWITGSTNKKLEEINSKELSDQKDICDRLTMKDQTKTPEKMALNKSLRSKEKMCPYSNIGHTSGKSVGKSISPIHSASSSVSIKDNFSTKPPKTISIVSGDKAVTDVCKIEDMKQSKLLKGNLIKDPLNSPKQRKCDKKDSVTDPFVKHSFNPQSHRPDVEGCLLKIKSEDKKQKHSSSLKSIFGIDLPGSLKHKLDDSIMNPPIPMQSCDLPSISRLHATVSSVKALKLESKTSIDPAEISGIKKELSCIQLNEKQSKKPTILPSCIQSEENTIANSEGDSVQFSSTEKPSRKRTKRYRSRKTSSSPEGSNDVLRRDDLLKTATSAHHGDTSSILSFKDNIEIEDNDVGDLGISELEQIREALRQQLLQDIDPSSEVFQSSDFDEQTEKSDDLEFPMKPTSVQLSGHVDESHILDRKDQPTSSHEAPHSFEEQSEDSFELSVNQFNCFVPKIADKPPTELPEVNFKDLPRKRPTLRFESMPENCPVNAVKQAERKKSDEADPTIDQPPLVMQSSNLLFNDELDNRHGGGGIETTLIKEEEPVTKRLKLSSDDNIKDSDQEPSAIVNDSKISSPSDDFEKQSLQPDDMASNSTLDHLNSEQNGVMEFDILDEFESDDNEPNESYSEDDSDLSADEIDAMLDAGLQNSKGATEGNKDLEHEEKEKVILKVRGRDHFDVLPEGWIEVTHNSGMPIYLHKQTRVCSVSKPYFLGPGSTRKHEIPVSAIPCLHYLRELEKEKSQPNVEENHEISNGPSEKLNDTAETVDNVNGISATVTNASEKVNGTNEKINSGSENINASNIPSAKLESVKDTKESGSLDYLAVREYCKNRFEFQTITVKRFRTWSGRRKHQKQLKRKQRPFLPDSTKLITCPLFPSTDKSSTLGNNAKREFIMNPSGKSPVCILHEYVQHTLRVQPKYIFKELESANTPYGAVVIIDGIEYGCGFGSSKKLAKSDAAKSALQILIPKMKMFAPETQNGEEAQDVEFFDQVRVEDPRVCDLSVKAGQPYPYQILLECLKRNYGMGDTEIEFWMTNLKHQKNEFYMKVGKHQVSVVCKNKRDGKHRASQAVLQRLHPHIKSWGSLLRMYGKGSCKTLKEKKEEEQRITELQSQACVNKPNISILNKLKEEMLKYREKMISKKPIGKLIPERMEFFSISNSNLNNVEL